MGLRRYVPSEGFTGESVSLTFPASRGCLEATLGCLAHGSILRLQSQPHSSFSLSDFLSPSYKDSYDYMG